MTLADYLASLTDAQYIRFGEKMWGRIMEGMGYQPYGYDLPTLWATRPGLAKLVVAYQSAYYRRKA